VPLLAKLFSKNLLKVLPVPTNNLPPLAVKPYIAPEPDREVVVPTKTKLLSWYFLIPAVVAV
jgi:hypothetical protein